jgi:hypothetical protein
MMMQETEIFDAEIDLESSGIKMEVKAEDIKEEVKEEEPEEVLLDQVVEVVPCPGSHLFSVLRNRRGSFHINSAAFLESLTEPTRILIIFCTFFRCHETLYRYYGKKMWAGKNQFCFLHKIGQLVPVTVSKNYLWFLIYILFRLRIGC